MPTQSRVATNQTAPLVKRDVRADDWALTETVLRHADGGAFAARLVERTTPGEG